MRGKWDGDDGPVGVCMSGHGCGDVNIYGLK